MRAGTEFSPEELELIRMLAKTNSVSLKITDSIPPQVHVFNAGIVTGEQYVTAVHGLVSAKLLGEVGEIYQVPEGARSRLKDFLPSSSEKADL